MSFEESSRDAPNPSHEDTLAATRAFGGGSLIDVRVLDGRVFGIGRREGQRYQAVGAALRARGEQVGIMALA